MDSMISIIETIGCTLPSRQPDQLLRNSGGSSELND